MFDGFSVIVNVKRMLGKFPRYSGHIRRLKCEDIFIIFKKLDARDFLFVI